MTGQEALVERAAAALSQELGIDRDAITLVSTEQVDWPDASLGCPQPGVMYAQVITPGYEIVLSAQGTHYSFHSSLNPNGPLVRCD